VTCSYRAYLNVPIISISDPVVVDAANNFDWYFVPILNRDGYEHTFEQDRLWRKNRKPYGIFRGVDLNRNFAANWNGTGSSADPKRYDFAGGAAESEPEVKVLADFLRANVEKFRIKTYLSLHSFSQLVMFPYGYTTDHVR
jgi:murein tripeptide amidase MpaA